MDTSQREKKFERLPTVVRPKSYKIHIKPSLEKFTFLVIESINVLINDPVDRITVNSVGLKYSKVELQHSNGDVFTPETKLSVEDETLSLFFPNPLATGSATVSFECSGTLNDDTKGFYRSSLRNDKSKYMAITQFESTYARMCFPCWDEPLIKAVFDITITAPKGCTAVSNMPVKDEVVESNGERTMIFETTPLMSTYLVAMCVGEYEYIESQTSDGVTLRLYTEPGLVNQGSFALEFTAKVLAFYKDYFGISYTLPKLDLMAAANFVGAMENWGLMLYHDHELLIDPVNSTKSRKQSVALTVAHEIGHMWFGNLVTMEWWTHLWLKEGFATYLQWYCCAHFFPEFELWTQFLGRQIYAYELDSLEGSHPIEVPVTHPSQIFEVFDSISYTKGSALIRLIQNYIGDSEFRKGLNLYLTRHQYKNTITEDLWEALEEVSSKPVRSVMYTWTSQKGFPLITVDAVHSPDHSSKPNTRTLNISQKKFSFTDFSSGEADSSLWLVPLSYYKSNSPTEIVKDIVLDKRETTIEVTNVSDDEFVKFNPDVVGFYRVKYPAEVLQQFLPSIKSKTMSALDRVGLVDDLFALARAGESDTAQFLKFIQEFSDEDNYVVWSTISNCLRKIKTLLANTELENSLDAFGRNLFKNIAKKIGWEAKENESYLDGKLRPLLIYDQCITFNDEEALKEATKRFQDHLQGVSVISNELKSTTYSAAMLNADEAAFEHMMKMYKECNISEEKDRIGEALCCCRNEQLLIKALEFAISDDVLIPNGCDMIISVTRTKLGRDVAWKFLQDNWQLIYVRFKHHFMLPAIVNSILCHFSKEEKVVEIENFMAGHEHSFVERKIKQVCGSIRQNADWLKRDFEGMKSFFLIN
uniref:Aminopeptidase n=1 Tax=Nilaparvata lugens TaxID=108931 RepID=A0A2L1IQ83_NILLU|nr:putative APN-5 [Nilaparvata lugens]